MGFCNLCMCGFCNMCFCVCVGFLIFMCVCFVYVCVDFVIYEFVYEWGLKCVGLLTFVRVFW